MTTDLIITKRRGLSFYLVLLAAAFASLVVSFYAGRFDSRSERLQLEQDKQELTDRILRFEQQVAQLQQDIVLLQSSASVDKQANAEIMDSITTLQKTIDAQETELSFYRNIMAPELDVKGLQIADFRWEPTREAKRFRFQLALTQAKEHKTFLKGNVVILLKGQLNGKVTQHNLLELSELPETAMNFQFKYFQNIKGELVLPEGFVPTEVQVTATTSGQKSTKINKVFKWSA